MNKKLLFLVIFCALFPFGVIYAHETRVYEISGWTYEFTVGSLKEPFVVDEVNGVSVSVRLVAEPALMSEIPVGEDVESVVDEELTGEEGTAIRFQEKTEAITDNLHKLFQFEIELGDARRSFDLIPVEGEAGRYYAVFIPTDNGALVYHLRGSAHEAFVDLAFSCNPGGERGGVDVAERIDLGGGVALVSSKGSFGCPVARAGLGFPAESVSYADMNKQSVEALQGATQARKEARSGRIFGIAGGLFGILGLFLAVSSMMKQRQGV